MPQEFLFKILLAGNGGVGKTTLLNKYINDKFNFETKMTIGVDILQKIILIDEAIECNLQLWDFGGQEYFRFLLDSFVMGAHGALLLFDLTTIVSLNNIDEWVDILRKYEKNLPIVLVGAKADLENLISVQENYILEQLEKYNLSSYLKISSKTGLNVKLVFEVLVKELIKNSGKDVIKQLDKNSDSFSSTLF